MSPYNDVLRDLQYYILNEYNINRFLDRKLKCVIKEKQPIIQTCKKTNNQIRKFSRSITSKRMAELDS